jgi:hypothetical protein
MMSSAAIPPEMPGRVAALRKRCVRHDEREAVGRCSQCEGGFCRECLTEHEDRMFCAPCFILHVGAGKRVRQGPRRDWRRCKAALLMVGSLLCMVGVFYLLGRVLAVIPPELHDGTIWKRVTEQ